MLKKASRRYQKSRQVWLFHTLTLLYCQGGSYQRPVRGGPVPAPAHRQLPADHRGHRALAGPGLQVYTVANCAPARSITSQLKGGIHCPKTQGKFRDVERGVARK
jgi:hypothetical protein